MRQKKDDSLSVLQRVVVLLGLSSCASLCLFPPCDWKCSSYTRGLYGDSSLGEYSSPNGHLWIGHVNDSKISYRPLEISGKVHGGSYIADVCVIVVDWGKLLVYGTSLLAAFLGFALLLKPNNLLWSFLWKSSKRLTVDGRIVRIGRRADRWLRAKLGLAPRRAPLPPDWNPKWWMIRLHYQITPHRRYGKVIPPKIQITPEQRSLLAKILRRVMKAKTDHDGDAVSDGLRDVQKLLANASNTQANKDGRKAVTLKTLWRSVIVMGILLTLFALIRPPYLSKETIRRDGQILAQYSTPIGHHWIWNPPQGIYDDQPGRRSHTGEPQVDLQRLLLYLGISAVVFGSGVALTLRFQQNRQKAARS